MLYTVPCYLSVLEFPVIDLFAADCTESLSLCGGFLWLWRAGAALEFQC